MSISGIQSGYSTISLLRKNAQAASGSYTPALDLLSTRHANVSDKKEENIAHTQATSSQPLLSSEANAVLLSQQEVDKSAADQGLDELFSNTPDNRHRGLSELPSLLLPSAENITAISEHVSLRFKEMLADYNIPSSPETITYNNEGKMILPSDYEYADELKQALKENPGIERELSTVNALTSHYVEMQKARPFHEEYAAAQSQAQIDAVVDKYSYLFNGNRKNSSIALSFSQDGTLSLMADGKSVKLTS